MFFKKKVGEGSARGGKNLQSIFIIFFSLPSLFLAVPWELGFCCSKMPFPAGRESPVRCPQEWGDKGFLGATWVRCGACPVPVLGWRCCSCIQGPAPITGSFGILVMAGPSQGGMCPQAGRTQGCSGSISISVSTSSLSLPASAALETLEQPHPPAPSTLSSLTFLTHPHWSKQSSQTF